jgi:hypothetical protein
VKARFRTSQWRSVGAETAVTDRHYRWRSPPGHFHGSNTGSNPIGGAKLAAARESSFRDDNPKAADLQNRSALPIHTLRPSARAVGFSKSGTGRGGMSIQSGRPGRN